MLIAVVVMRFVIERTPNLIPNENLVIVHVLLFTATTTLWIIDRWYFFGATKAMGSYWENPTYENDVNWTYASASSLKVDTVYITADTLLNLFMLYMLH